MAKAENLERELNTQKEIMKQIESTKKEYIDRLKRELDTIEQRYQQIVNENCMLGEDYRSQAHHNMERNIMLSRTVANLRDMIDAKNETIKEMDISITAHKTETEQEMMRYEDAMTELGMSRETCDTWKSKYEIEEERARELENDIGALQRELAEIRDQEPVETFEKEEQTDLGAEYFLERQRMEAEL